MGATKKRRDSLPVTAEKHVTTRSVKKVVTDFPMPLFRETERAAHELSMNRSSLIRTAVEAYLQNRRREKLERAIAESFAANVELDRQLVDEFKHVDADLTLDAE
jgi:metal-responsive CopG/Arc/MetJ family transcriptional regulator